MLKGSWKSVIRISVISGIATVLTACGGGGGSSAGTPATSGTCAVAANCTLPSSVAGVPPQN